MEQEESTKVAVVTGSGRVNGVGSATAQLLAKNGYDIVLNCVESFDQVKEVQKLCESYDVKVEPCFGDLTEPKYCQQLSALVEERWGYLNVLVNCIGVTKSAPYERLDLLKKEDFTEIFSVNVTAPFLVTQSLQHLLRKCNGDIINISSAAGITGKGSSIAYAAAKGGENTLTLALAQALSPEIKVNAICPSFIDSSWWEKSFHGKEEQYQNLLENMAENNLLNKNLKPYDVAKTVLSIIENPVMTGELIRLDAGSHIGKANKR